MGVAWFWNAFFSMEQSTVEICNACSKGDLDLVKRLITRGTSPWVRDDQANTLFHLCCSSHHCGLNVLQYLIATSEIVSCGYLRNNEGSTPLHLSCGAGRKEFVEFLIHGHHNDNFDFSLQNYQGETPLYFASRNGHSNIVSLICTNHDYILDPDDIYQCIKVAPNWDIMAILLRAISFNDFMTRIRQQNHVYLAKQIFKTSVTTEWKDSSSPPLHQVARSGDLDIVEYLVNEVGCDVNSLDSEAYTPLHRAIEYGHLPIVQYLLSQPQCNCETRSNNCGMYPLHHAAWLGYLDIIKTLVGRDCDINVKDENNLTPLHYSCGCGHLPVVIYLTNHPQCVISSKDKRGRVPLHIAAECGQLHIAKFLIEDMNVDINLVGHHRETPLYMACWHGHLPLVEYFTSQSHCNINLKDQRGQHPLLIAACRGHLEIVKHLVDSKGCGINVSDDKGYTPIHNACNNGHLSVVEYLSSKPQCNIEVLDNTGHQPLHYALCQGHKEIVMLLREKVSVDGIHQCIKSAVEDKVPGSMIELLVRMIGIKEYLTRRLEEDQPTFSSNDTVLRDIIEADCPLHKAVELGCVDVTEYLVNIGVFDINLKFQIYPYYKYTPLHIACEKGHFEIVKILTNHPQCNIEAENNIKQRPLHKACESGNVDIVQHLVLEKGCDVTAKDGDSDTPLHIACEKGHFATVKLLTNHPQCNIEAENKDCNRPLHLACQSGNIDIVRYLVKDKGCDITAKNFDGNIALHIACNFHYFNVVELLTNCPQCDIEAENNAHQTPLLLACEIKHYTLPIYIYRCKATVKRNQIDIIRLLASKGCDISVASDRQLHSTFSRYQQALRNSGEAKLRVVKCILTGPPGAGKSTLKKRLLNESLTEPSLSTGVVDAAIQVDSFRKLQQHNAVVTTEWRTQDLDEEAVLTLENIASNTVHSHPLHPNIETVHPDRSVTCRDNIIDIRDDYTDELEEDSSDSYSDGEVSIMVQEDAEGMGDLVEEIEEEEIDYSNVGFKENTETTKTNKGINFLSKCVESIPVTKQKVYKERSQQTTKDSHAMLHIIDTGGQPEFHEMLPALITGPAINLLVFDLTIDLTSRYEITYRSSSGDSKPYQTSLTHEEVIFRSLASIACLRQNTIGWSFDEVPLKDESEPAAFLIATHRDCFPNEAEAQTKVDSVNNHLKLKIQASAELFSEGLVQYSTANEVIFPLDTRNDQEEIVELRSLLHRVISNKFRELLVPASWCAFSLKLRKSKKPIHLLDTCYRMAQDCGIKDREDFKSVLWFLHHRVGVIMHYPEVEGLGNIVITDLQLVFDRITHLITSCFTFEELGNAAFEKEFCDNGRFNESLVKQLSSKKGDPLTPTRLVSLLKHLHIVAGPMKIRVGCKSENYYFMPCALKPTPVEEEQRDESICPAPLTIYFECGYTPVGVFCCLVVYLLSQTSKSELEWKLHDKIGHHRNKITFIIGKYYDRITLISRATYLEVWVDQITPKLLLDVLCEQIISTLHRGLETVTQSLHYTYKSHHFFGFTCCCPESHSLPSHPAIVDVNDLAAECVLTRKVMHLEERRHLVWSTKVYSLFPCIHYILCNTH